MKQSALGYRKNLGKRALSLRQVLSMMSKDWNVFLIILTVIIMLFLNFVTKAGGMTTFIKH